MKKISLRLKTVYIVLIISIVLCFAIYVFGANKISNGFLKIEKQNDLEHISQVNDAILERSQNMISKLSDWGQWDDAFLYVKNRNKAFEKSNLQNSLTNLKFDHFSIWSDKRELIWGSQVDGLTEDESKKLTPLLKQDVEKIKTIDGFFSAINFQDKKFIFLMLEEGPYLFVTVPVTSTNGEEPVDGFIIAGVKLNEYFFKNLSNKLHLDITVVNPITSNEDFSKASQHLKLIDEHTILGYQLIEDFLGKKLVIFQIKFERDIYLQAKSTVQTFLYSMIFVGMFFCVVMVWALDKLVVKRVIKLSNQIKMISEKSDAKIRVEVDGADEIANLAIAFNEALEEIEKLRATSFNKEKLASLGEMAGGIAHEINNPIGIISASNMMIRRNLQKGISDPEKLGKHLDEIDNTIVRVTKIISGLRNVSRDTSNEEFGISSILDILDDALGICSGKFAAHGVVIKLDRSNPAFTLKIRCLRVQLSQVFFNLLGNAYDAIGSKTNPWIEINAKIVGNEIEIRFIDSGLGIPKELHQKILQPFYTTKEVGKGTGLGLSLANNIIIQHKGKLRIDEECKNTCFVINLPLN